MPHIKRHINGASILFPGDKPQAAATQDAPALPTHTEEGGETKKIRKQSKRKAKR